MSEHTKEPWAFDKYGQVVDGDNESIVLAKFALSTGSRNNVAVENTRRIVACVNACAGLDTELLENIVLTGDTLKARFEALKVEAKNE